MIQVFQPNLTFKDKLAVYRALLKNNISGTSPEVEMVTLLLPKSRPSLSLIIFTAFLTLS